MADTFTELQYHCIWSTKNREALIRPEIESRIWKILAVTATKHGMHITRAGGIENHVHVLVSIPKTMSVSEAMKQLKGGSSNAINEAALFGGAKFAWQKGYGAFTVSTSNVPGVVEYIAKQREHHKRVSFEDEYVKFLEKHRIDYEPKYLWD